MSVATKLTMSEGTNLLGARYVMPFEPSWTKTKEQQIKARAYRVG